MLNVIYLKLLLLVKEVIVWGVISLQSRVIAGESLTADR